MSDFANPSRLSHFCGAVNTLDVSKRINRVRLHRLWTASFTDDNPTFEVEAEEHDKIMTFLMSSDDPNSSSQLQLYAFTRLVNNLRRRLRAASHSGGNATPGYGSPNSSVSTTPATSLKSFPAPDV